MQGESGNHTGDHQRDEPKVEEPVPRSRALKAGESHGETSILGILLLTTDAYESADLSTGGLVESIPFGCERRIDVRCS